MILLLSLMASACPKQARCLQVPVQTSMGEIPLDVQVWFPEYENDTTPLYFIVGGPGQSGVDASRYIAPFLRFLNRSIVFFSPLGTQPNDWFPCDTQTSTLSQLFGDVKTEPKCLPKKGFVVEEVNSEHAAQHVHRIREMLGHDKIVLLGNSYGGRVVQLYVQKYPHTVRQLIIDSGIPLEYHIGMSSFAEDILEKKLDDAGKRALNTILDDLPALIQTFDPSTRERVSLSIDQDDFFLILHRWMYHASDQDKLNQILMQVSKGHWNGFLQIAKEALNDRYSLGTYLSVFCQEDWSILCDQEPSSRFPFCMKMTKKCSLWPQPSSMPSWEAKDWDVPTLILHGRFDHVSPPLYAKTIQQHASPSIRVEFLNQAHGVLLSNCARDIMYDFLAQNDIDENHRSCQKEIHIERQQILDRLWIVDSVCNSWNCAWKWDERLNRLTSGPRAVVDAHIQSDIHFALRDDLSRKREVEFQ